MAIIITIVRFDSEIFTAVTYNVIGDLAPDRIVGDLFGDIGETGKEVLHVVQFHPRLLSQPGRVWLRRFLLYYE